MINKPNKTNKEGIKDEVIKIATLADKLYRIVKEQHSKLFWSIWDNPNATPQEIFDAMVEGDAVNSFAESQAIQELLSSINPDYEPLMPPYDYTIEDGAVKVGERNEVEMPADKI